MKVRLLPCYTVSFSCDCTVCEATQRILKAADWEANYFKIKEVTCSNAKKFLLSTSTGSFLYRNASMPIVSIEIGESDGSTQISMSFELRKSVKVFTVVYGVCALLLLLFLSLYCVVMKEITLALCFPIGLLLIVFAISHIGLSFASKDVFWILFVAIMGDDKHIPRIHRVKHSK